MEPTPINAPFLQNFYQQDTLYVVPEENPLHHQPVPAGAAVVAHSINSEKEIPNQSSKSEIEVANENVALTESALEPDITWLGQATKGTYLLFEVPTDAFNQLPNHAFLKKVLAAVGLETLEVKFGNLSANKTHNIKQIALAQQARHILVFGDDVPIENLAKLEPYRMYKLDETRFVRVDALRSIEQSQELKGKLWEVLQKIFLQPE